MSSAKPVLIHPSGAKRRGPKPRSWYEACVRHALRYYGNPRSLRRNPLIESHAIIALAEERFTSTWSPRVAALRYAISQSVEEVIATADDMDRDRLETVLHGAMQGRTVAAIAAELSYSREWLHRTWWPDAVRATTSVALRRWLKVWAGEQDTGLSDFGAKRLAG